jgi:hypothetical protein
MTEAQLSPDEKTLTVSVPLVIRRRGGRKHVVAPDGTPAWAPRQRHIDSTLVKAMARAFRWRKLLETGQYATIDEIGAAEKINCSYVSRVMRLTLLAPDIVEAILDGRASAELTLPALFRPFPVEWEGQTDLLRLFPLRWNRQAESFRTPLSRDYPSAATAKRSFSNPRTCEQLTR